MICAVCGGDYNCETAPGAVMILAPKQAGPVVPIAKAHVCRSCQDAYVRQWKHQPAEQQEAGR